ncbi:hypothetical protein [Govanella unica]|uniref:Uncharacterized protein n=1 Tax=Govanella unica TaxID=2975056 RepID=A0A9X3TXV2_9PROT|nr:hypothetical protein [Govania unica]MDA5193781.1 hypothetical protein [Govania unica]
MFSETSKESWSKDQEKILILGILDLVKQSDAGVVFENNFFGWFDLLEPDVKKLEDLFLKEIKYISVEYHDFLLLIKEGTNDHEKVKKEIIDWLSSRIDGNSQFVETTLSNEFSDLTFNDLSFENRIVFYPMNSQSGYMPGLSKDVNEKILSQFKDCESPLQKYIGALIDVLRSDIEKFDHNSTRLLINQENRDGFDTLINSKKSSFITAYNNSHDIEIRKSKNVQDVKVELITWLSGVKTKADAIFSTQIQDCIDILRTLLNRLAPEDRTDLSFDKLLGLLPSKQCQKFYDLNAGQAKGFIEGFIKIVSEAGIIDVAYVKSALLKDLNSWILKNYNSDEYKRTVANSVCSSINGMKIIELEDLNFYKIFSTVGNYSEVVLNYLDIDVVDFENYYNSALHNLSKPRYPKESMEKILTSLLDLVLTADKDFPENGKAKYKKKPVCTLDSLFYEICKYDAFADLLNGKLQRLDPVIQESGCQWRVPFVLDLHELLVKSCATIPVAKFWIEEYTEKRKICFDMLKFLKNYDVLRLIMATLESYKKDKTVGKELILSDKILDFLDSNRHFSEINDSEYDKKTFWIKNPEKIIQLIEVNSNKNISILFEVIDNLKEYAVGFIFLINLLEKDMKKFDSIVDGSKIEYKKSKNGKENLKHSFDSLKYLTLCKVYTVNRIRRMDTFGLSGVRIDLKMPLTGKNDGEYTQILARSSRKYMFHVATCVAKADEPLANEEFLRISDVNKNLILSNKVGTFQNSTSFSTHVFYGPLCMILTYQSIKKQPILIDIRRLECEVINDVLLYINPKTGKTYKNARYSLNGAALLYFEPDDAGNFIYYPEPTLEQRRKVGMYVECYSIYRKDIAENATGELAIVSPEKFSDYIDVVKSSWIVDWVLFGACQHDEFPYPLCWLEEPQEGKKSKRTRLEKAKPDNVVVADRNIQNLYFEMHNKVEIGEITCGSLLKSSGKLLGTTTEDTHLWRERLMFQELVKLFGIKSTAYKDYSSDRSNGYRSDEPVVFGPIHIYGSTYEHKIKEIEALLKKNEREPIKVERLMDPKDEEDLDL